MDKEQRQILDRELRWSWDGARDRETLIVRRMLHDDPKQVIKDYEIDFLRELYLKKLHLFDKINKNFWKLALKVSDEEIDRATDKNPRLSCKVWNV